MGKRSPGPMSYIREASVLRNIKFDVTQDAHYMTLKPFYAHDKQASMSPFC